MLMNPLSDAEREFEDHERELWRELMARMEGSVPNGATVGEAIEAMQQAAVYDPEIKELLFRAISIATLGGGTYLQEMLAGSLPPLPDNEPVYQLTDQPTKPIVQEEIRLMERLRREIDARIGTEVEGAERRARIRELLDEDEELAALAERLDKLSQSHDESVMLGLAKLAEEEAEEEEDEPEL
jgi:GTPase Era involved in 16S rRNA processing